MDWYAAAREAVRLRRHRDSGMPISLKLAVERVIADKRQRRRSTRHFHKSWAERKARRIRIRNFKCRHCGGATRYERYDDSFWCIKCRRDAYFHETD